MSPETWRYETEIDLSDENTAHTKSIRLIGDNKRVVDFGCSTGFVAAALKEHGCTVTGFEINPDAAESARQHCEKVIVGDLDLLDVASELEGEYDAALFGDVIEHLKDPKRVLLAAREKLAPGGFVVLSVPNVAHVSVRLALLKGQFDYEDTGILDATHLRFYTRESIADLLESCGYMVEVMDWVDHRITEEGLREALDPLGLASMEEVVKAFSEWEAVAFQYVVKAFPATEEAQMQKLSEEKVQAEQKLRSLERQIDHYRKTAEATESLEEELEKSAEYQKSLEDAIAAKDTYIVQLENAVAESRVRLEQCEVKIGEMAGMLQNIESEQPKKKKRGLLSDR